MSPINERVLAVAKALIAAVSMSAAVNATDVRAQAARLHKEYAEYSQVQLTTKIASEIKKHHRPGISGSL